MEGSSVMRISMKIEKWNGECGEMAEKEGGRGWWGDGKEGRRLRRC